MNISNERRESLEKTYQYYLHHEAVLKMKEIPAHRGSNVYLHTFRVTRTVIRKALKSHHELDLENLLIASIFHDYYLYDWRTTKDRPRPHGKNHPHIAVKNAKRDFNISDKAAEYIETHMWPINFFKPPKTREARLLDNADTWVAFKEILTSKKHKRKRETDSLNQIATLF